MWILTKIFRSKTENCWIKPVETVNADGTRSYTSGRINTQENMILSMDILSAVQKFRPEKGYLPAFWMMPTDENLYGQ